TRHSLRHSLPVALHASLSATSNLSLHDALPICLREDAGDQHREVVLHAAGDRAAEDEREHRGEQQRLDEHVEELLGLAAHLHQRSEEHTSELQSRENLVCRLLLEKYKIQRLTAA